MTRLPDSSWWNSVQFTVGSAQPNGGQGFAMSREEMSELLRLARQMERLIGEQFAAQRAMVEIEPPANDPASHAYLGVPDRQAPTGARGAGEAYTSRLREQAGYLNQLIGKLSDALRSVEVRDDGIAQDLSRIRNTLS